MIKYRVEKKTAWKRYLITSECGRQYWDKMVSPIRKEHACANCATVFAADSAIMYSPGASAPNRKDRLCAQCVEGVIVETVA
jgi:ribosomal protein S27AE